MLRLLFIFVFLFLLSHECLCDNLKGSVIAAFGDFDNGKVPDVLTLSSDLKSIIINTFSLSDFGEISNKEWLTLKADCEIASVIPGDFDGDSRMDILYTCQSDNNYNLNIFWRDDTSFSASQPLKSSTGPISLNGEPFIADVNGDQFPDIISQGDAGIIVWYCDNSSPRQRISAEFSAIADIATPIQLDPLGAHAFVNVVGDDQPDLVFVTSDAKNKFSVWEGSLGHYSKQMVIHFMETYEYIGQPSFLDMDNDGTAEMVVPVCEDTSCASAHIVIYDFQDKSFSTIFTLSNSFLDYVFLNDFSSMSSHISMFLRVADIDLDSYPDLHIVVSKNGETDLLVLMNVECSASQCYKQRALLPELQGMAGVLLAANLDLEMDGRNDFIYSTKKSQKNATILTRLVSNQNGNNFLKVQAVGGLCKPGSCPFGEYNYGSNLPGPTFRYETTSLSGRDKMSVATQLPQATGFALQPPYVLFGLKTSPDFVRKVKVTLGSGERVKGDITLTNIIPNAQIIIIPYPPNNPSEWSYQLLMIPSAIVLQMLGCLAGLVVLLMAIVGGLHYQEKRADEKEKQQEANRFHFDAM